MNSPDRSQADEFKLERYKFIPNQISSLDRNAHIYLTVFQTLATAIIGGGVAIIVGWKQFAVEPELAAAGMLGLLWLLGLLGAFVVVVLFITVIAWYDYRVEESSLANSVVGPNFRAKPRARNFWRWSETYHILFVAAAIAAVWLYASQQILPLLTPNEGPKSSPTTTTADDVPEP